MFYHHDVIKLRLKAGGECYALDLTGAQFGYYDPITPWQEYIDTHVLSFPPRKSPDYFGKLKNWHLREIGKREEKDTFCAIVDLNMATSGLLMRFMKTWETVGKMTIYELLRLPLQDTSTGRINWCVCSLLESRLSWMV